MNKKLTILAVMVFTLLIGVPSDGLAATSIERDRSVSSGSSTQILVRYGQPRRRRSRRGVYWRNGVQYRNYGQFRRNIAGNRRYRLVPRYYWDDGRRYTRYVRVY